jgi:hypothetical protein
MGSGQFPIRARMGSGQFPIRARMGSGQFPIRAVVPKWLLMGPAAVWTAEREWSTWALNDMTILLTEF